jgi:hypothetical protein
MPKKKPTRAERRANLSWIIISVFVIGSLGLTAVASLVGPVQAPPTPTEPIFVTILPVRPNTPTPGGTPTTTPLAPVAPPGPAVAPTQ